MLQQTKRTAPAGDCALIQGMDGWHRQACRAQRNVLSCIAEVDRRGLWKYDGARDMAHWLRMRYGLSEWKARRWIASAHALTSLPVVTNAFASGALGVDKVVELCRFATAENEETLVVWAQRVSAGAIRSRGDREIRQSLHDVREIERSRYLRSWHEDDGRTLCLEGRMPVAAGAVVMKALERISEQLPSVPVGDDPPGRDARRADALVALASVRIASDPDPGPRDGGGARALGDPHRITRQPQRTHRWGRRVGLWARGGAA